MISEPWSVENILKTSMMAFVQYSIPYTYLFEEKIPNSGEYLCFTQKLLKLVKTSNLTKTSDLPALLYQHYIQLCLYFGLL